MVISKIKSNSSSRISNCEKVLSELLREGKECSVFSRAAAAVFGSDGYVCVATHDVDDTFDLASITKVVTSVLAHKHLKLDHLLSTLNYRKSVSDILHHSSGLPAWKPYFALASSYLGMPYASLLNDQQLQGKVKEFVLNDLRTISLLSPKPTYSDIGYLALGYEIEIVTQKPPHELLLYTINPHFDIAGDKVVWGSPINTFVTTGVGRPRAGTPLPSFATLKSVEIQPEAVDSKCDDDNAAVLGDAVGHAGLWANVSWVGELGLRILQSRLGESSLLPESRAWDILRLHNNSGRTAGLNVDIDQGDTQIGSHLCKGVNAGGIQTGFTGGSICLDTKLNVSIVLLSNAVKHERPSSRIRLFRPHFHDSIACVLNM